MAVIEQISVKDILVALKNILNAIVNPMWQDNATGRLNINNITTLTTCATVTNCATVGTMTNLSGFSTRDNVVFPLELANWSQSVRNRIT